MTLLLFLLALAGGFFLLAKGSDYFVDGAAGIAGKFGIPQIIIALTIVAMGTSAPEAAVSIAAAFQGNADISIGNVIGSNIMNICIILGLCAVITPLAVKRSTVRYEMPFLIFVSLVLLLLGLDGNVGRINGIILIVLFIIYLGYLFAEAKNGREQQTEDEKQKNIGLLLLFLVGGLAAVVIGSKLAVYGATGLAEAFGLSERFIGLTIVALGTSLPELFTCVAAAKKGNDDIAIGTIVGSNIFNILFVIGLTSLITNVPYQSKFIIDGLVMIAIVIFLWICVLVRKKLTRTAGICLLVLYAAYFVYLLKG
ncbi:MAG: calcium/sodium antiporter [Lachnospiraceae bacterium]|nr:calcium/sodium antiporter [Lachnospiraceae bacterium]